MIKPIRTKRDYKHAVARIYELMQKELSVNSAEYNELEVLSILADVYEQNNFPIDLPDPIEAIKFRMEQMGYDFAKLSEVLGSKSHVSEILQGKRKLSLTMIRTLHKELKIPAESLIKAY
jgi:HTH-type transcriptional regulator / antitoxin HigA